LRNLSDLKVSARLLGISVSQQFDLVRCDTGPIVS
jgi:hypothetical protein